MLNFLGCFVNNVTQQTVIADILQVKLLKYLCLSCFVWFDDPNQTWLAFKSACKSLIL